VEKEKSGESFMETSSLMLSQSDDMVYNLDILIAAW